MPGDVARPPRAEVASLRAVEGEPSGRSDAGATTLRDSRILQATWVCTGLFAVTAVPYALGLDALERVSVAVDVTLFVVSLPVWVYAFLAAVGRTAQGDDIAVASLFFLSGSAPRAVRRHLGGALVACLAVTAATAKANPFGVLVPMLPMGLMGLWGARHGTYPQRPARQR